MGIAAVGRMARVPDEEDAARRPAGELFRGPGKERRALVQHDHAGAARGLVQVGSGPEHGHAAPGELLHHAPELPPGLRVHAHARLVQKEQARRAQKRAGDAELLLHAAGKPPGQPLREGGERREGKQAAEKPLARLPFHTAQAGIETQVGHDRQVLVKAETLRHIADAVGLAPQKLGHREAEDAQGAARGVEKPGEQAHERGLARGVRPHEPGDAPGGDAGRDAPEGLLAAPALAKIHAQVVKDDGRSVFRGRRGRGGPGFHGAGASTRMVTGIPWRMTFSGSSACTRRR